MTEKKDEKSEREKWISGSYDDLGVEFRSRKILTHRAIGGNESKGEKDGGVWRKKETLFFEMGESKAEEGRICPACHFVTEKLGKFLSFQKKKVKGFTCWTDRPFLRMFSM